MTWSDKAREAAIMARRLHRKRRGMQEIINEEKQYPTFKAARRLSEAKANFHVGGTPKRDPHYTTSLARQSAARQLRSVRADLRAGEGYDWTFHEQKISYAAQVSAHGRYFGKDKSVSQPSGIPRTKSKRRGRLMKQPAGR